MIEMNVWMNERLWLLSVATKDALYLYECK